MSETPGFSVIVQPDDKVTRGLSSLARNIQNLDPALEAIGDSLVTSTQLRFEAEESPEGEPWKGLSLATLANRKREGKDGEARILRDNADMYDSLQPKLLAGQGVQVGVTRVQGRIHQLGGMAGRGRQVEIEARPYLGVSEADREEILAIMNDHAQRGVA
jgi:phage virion morphogenesis protein